MNKNISNLKTKNNEGEMGTEITKTVKKYVQQAVKCNPFCCGE